MMAGPVHEGPAEGAITAGDQLMTSAAAGRQVVTCPPSSAFSGTNPTGDAARAVIGVALTTAGAGQVVRWMQR